MNVSVMASGQIGSDGTGTISGTHSPGGQPHAVVVFVVQNGTSANEVSTITYGGIAMTAGLAGTDTSGEPGRTVAYSLDSKDGIPTGNQTVELTVSGATSKRVYCVSLFSDSGGLIRGSMASDSENSANPSNAFSISSSRYASGVACLFSGLAATSVSVANGAELAESNFSGGLQCASLIWANATVNNGTLTMGWTSATDDVAASYITFNELIPMSGNVKLSGSNIQNAKVFPVYLDTDDIGDNFSTVTGESYVLTDASGNWSAYTYKGVFPYVFYTYDTGGQFYTAPLHYNMDTTP